jgi:RNA polymerase sigma factor (sigma-70 family)
LRPCDEEKLVRRCGHGDRQAYEALVDHYARIVFGLCLSTTRNPTDAEDLTQEVFMKGYLKINELTDTSRFRPWLLRICRNQCTDYVRARQRDQARQAPCPREGYVKNGSPIKDTLDAALTQLPEKYRQPLILYYLNGQDTKAVARVLGITPAGVLTRLCRARHSMRTLLTQETNHE